MKYSACRCKNCLPQLAIHKLESEILFILNSFMSESNLPAILRNGRGRFAFIVPVGTGKVILWPRTALPHPGFSGKRTWRQSSVARVLMRVSGRVRGRGWVGHRERSSPPNGLSAHHSCSSWDETGLDPSLCERPSQEHRTLGEGAFQSKSNVCRSW